jgi:hypothetical protein
MALATARELDDAAEVALEDYARALARAAAAEAYRDARDTARVAGVHVCRAASAPEPGALADLDAFARELASRSEGGGLGWS